jgi:heat shock protein HslJ
MKERWILVVLAALFYQCKSQQQITEVGLTLENTYWKLVEVNGILVSTPKNGQEVHMVLTQEKGAGVLKGHAGCNGLGGNYRLEGNTIKFQPITTRLFCESHMDVENLFTRMLTAADYYRIDNGTLQLFGDHDLLGKFDAVARK